MTPDEYNDLRYAKGDITPADFTKLVKLAQEKLGVRPDGFCGPVTLEALNPAPPEVLVVDEYGWLNHAIKIPTHPSWRGGQLPTPGNQPLGIVVHTSDTNHGTAISMAKRRARQFGLDPGADRMSSWHASVEGDGSWVQMVPFNTCAWHAGSHSARKLPFGWANYTTIGIEIISPDDKNFPPAQIEAAKLLWRALVRAYNIPRERAMIAHGSFEDPNRRVDPGPIWMGGRDLSVVAPGSIAEVVLNYAYA